MLFKCLCLHTDRLEPYMYFQSIVDKDIENCRSTAKCICLHDSLNVKNAIATTIS